jgi:hypothetical protein
LIRPEKAEVTTCGRRVKDVLIGLGIIAAVLLELVVMIPFGGSTVQTSAAMRLEFALAALRLVVS